MQALFVGLLCLCNVQRAHSLRIEFRYYKNNFGETVITCFVDFHPNYRMNVETSILKDSKNLTKNGNIYDDDLLRRADVRLFTGSSIDLQYTELILKNAKREDTGVYQCCIHVDYADVVGKLCSDEMDFTVT